MKRVLALWIAAMLMIALTACGNSDEKSKSEGSSSAAEVTQSAAATEAVTEAPAATEATAETVADDETLIAESKAKLIGSWSYTGMEDFVRLTFNDDGTGSYKGLDTDEFTFTYTVTMAHKEYNNGAPYIDKMLNVDCGTGDKEEIVFDFREEAKEELTFHNPDGSGYNGVLSYYGGWTRV